MRYISAMNILKKELDLLTERIVPKEQQITELIAEIEEYKMQQEELIEAIKQLGATSGEQHDNTGTDN